MKTPIKITASPGKVFRRRSDNLIVGSEHYLGYTYYLSNILLKEPIWELPEHYEEIDNPDLETPFLEVEEVINPDSDSPRTVSIKDFLLLEETVKELQSQLKSIKE